MTVPEPWLSALIVLAIIGAMTVVLVWVAAIVVALRYWRSR